MQPRHDAAGDVLVDLVAVDDQLHAMADQEDDHDRHQHRGHRDVALLALRHSTYTYQIESTFSFRTSSAINSNSSPLPRPPPVSLVHRSDDEHIEDYHDAARQDAHEDEVGQQEVILDVADVLSERSGQDAQLRVVHHVARVRLFVPLHVGDVLPRHLVLEEPK